MEILLLIRYVPLGMAGKDATEENWESMLKSDMAVRGRKTLILTSIIRLFEVHGDAAVSQNQLLLIDRSDLR